MTQKKVFIFILGGMIFVFGGIAVLAESTSSMQITATIENALSLSFGELDFGQVSGEDAPSSSVSLALSQAFLETQGVQALSYQIFKAHKPKNEEYFDFCQRKENFPSVSSWQTWPEQKWQDFLESSYLEKCFLPLCPYLEIKKSEEEAEENGDLFEVRPQMDNPAGNLGFLDVLLEQGVSNSLPIPFSDQKDHGLLAPHYPQTSSGTFEYPFAQGYLSKSLDDSVDTWIISLQTPCFVGSCPEDWWGEDFDKLPLELKNQEWGCDLWFEVRGIERPDANKADSSVAAAIGSSQ